MIDAYHPSRGRNGTDRRSILLACFGALSVALLMIVPAVLKSITGEERLAARRMTMPVLTQELNSRIVPFQKSGQSLSFHTSLPWTNGQFDANVDARMTRRNVRAKCSVGAEYLMIVKVSFFDQERLDPQPKTPEKFTFCHGPAGLVPVQLPGSG
jgi:hypothetical protein